MPYIVSFVRPVIIADREQYINECCVGGDLVLEPLLPSLRDRYEDLQSHQEDWGWFAWFESSGVRLAVDVHTEDAATGSFQVHLTSRVPGVLFGDRVRDVAELDALRDLVVSMLKSWGATRLQVERVDEKYMPR